MGGVVERWVVGMEEGEEDGCVGCVEDGEEGGFGVVCYMLSDGGAVEPGTFLFAAWVSYDL